MKVRWQKLLKIIFFWLFCEIVLNLLELDNLADYGEFIGKQNLKIEIDKRL